MRSQLLAIAALSALSAAQQNSRAWDPKDTDTQWTAAYAKATTTLQTLTLADKAGIVSGTGWMEGPCVGNTRAVPSIGLPSLCLQDGPLGVRYAAGVSVFPAGVHTAATWDVDFMRQRGAALGAEAKALGIHVQLGPVAGPLGKIPQGGRNWEGFSPDPYLTGVAMAETIKGMQSAGVQACAKHFIGNEQELDRMEISSDIGDREMHELYLWPFAESIKAGVASMMCSYNKVNGSWACESEAVMQKLAKEELKFKGYVMSDWNAQHSTVQSANNGLDMTMPGDNFGDKKFLWGNNVLLTAIKDGKVKQSRLDDMVLRILAGWYLLHQDKSYPPVKFSSWKNGGKGGPDSYKLHTEIARFVARDGIVLLKNEGDLLPLGNKTNSLAVVGEDAVNGAKGPNGFPDRGSSEGTLAVGWGSGTAEFPYLVDPLTAIKAQASKLNLPLSTSTTNNLAAASSAAAAAKTAIVFINANSGEGYMTVDGIPGDRANLDPWKNGNALVKAVADANPNTIVVIHSVGPIILESILANSGVKAVVWAGLPGQESGNALVDILWGVNNGPSGKLPFTIAKKEADYGTSVVKGKTDKFAEGMDVDYRGFERKKIEPRYEFGFGLSYTSFTYTNLTIISATPPPPLPPPTGLYEPFATLALNIRNTGARHGAEVAQLYVTLPGSGQVRQLRGFTKRMLLVGESAEFKFLLRRKDLSSWSVEKQKWVLSTGDVVVEVGASVKDVRAKGMLTLGGPAVSLRVVDIGEGSQVEK